ncbi:hypothetical protein PCANB_002448 [Pneumocystis canis]|nr:hypothetical protein PCANB_002448 [Pneumocystis canis]
MQRKNRVLYYQKLFRENAYMPVYMRTPRSKLMIYPFLVVWGTSLIGALWTTMNMIKNKANIMKIHFISEYNLYKKNKQMEDFEDNNLLFEESYGYQHTFYQDSQQILTSNEINEEHLTEINSDKTDTICCHIHAFIDNNHDEPLISILDAEKVSEGNSRRFVVYIIRMGAIEVRRRYSEFESLRISLSRLFPTVIVPPIPGKPNTSISSSRTKINVDVISQRKRMLQIFLNRCVSHLILKKCHVFHCFLDKNISWSEILTSPPISLLPQSILMAPPLNPGSGTSDPIYQCLPIPSSTAKLINVSNKNEIKFIELEKKIKEVQHIIGNETKKTNNSIMRNFQNLADSFCELGAAYNALSITQQGSLATGIERFGLANDSNFHSNYEFIENLDFILSEPLKELSQFYEVAKSRLIYRRQKILQYEIIVDILNQNKNVLDTLEKSEIKAQKIETSLARLENNCSNLSLLNSDESNKQGKEQLKQTKPNFFEKLTTAMKGMIDVDPTINRKKGIEKIYEKISLLENALKITKRDANIAVEVIKEELERFQDMVRKNYCELMIDVGKCYMEWAKKNIKIWEDAKYLT